MKQNKISSIILGLIACSMFATSCSETDYLIYDKDYSGIYFTRDTLEYSFGVSPIEKREHLFKVPMQIMGIPMEQTREVAFEILPDSTTAQEGVQYRIGDAVIEADSIVGYIPLTILRDGLEGNYTDGYTRYRVGIRLKSNKNFVPTRSLKDQIRVIEFDNAIDQPEWLDYKGDKVWSESTLGKWHPLKLIKMVEYFHELENILPETYNNIVVAYGENLENIPYGSPYQYKTTFNKYIYAPMYEYFNDPANKEEIDNLYPDFPYDFPNPFSGQ